MVELIHGDLSYRIIGILYKVYNSLGGGYQEKYYQKLLKKEFGAQKVPCLEQVRADLVVNGEFLGRYYLDFVIDHKIALEIKVRANFSHRDIRQVLCYLKQSGLELGILATFAPEALKYKRILRGYN